MINDLALFSDNEDLDEVPTTDLRYNGTLLVIYKFGKARYKKIVLPNLAADKVFGNSSGQLAMKNTL